MGAYDLFYLGWAKETVPGTSPIVNAASTAYLIGSTDASSPLPDPDWDYVSMPPLWGERKTSEVIKTVPDVATPSFAFLPHNGVPFWMALGKSSTVGGAPPYTHTITTASQSGGIIAELPSITLHAERLDQAAVLSDWVTQYTGCKNAAARIFCGDEHPTLTCVYSWLGMAAAKQAFKLTNKPADITGTPSTGKHYLWNGSTHTYDGSTVEGMTYWELLIENGTYAIPPQYGSQWPEAIYQGGQQTIKLTVRYKPQVLTLHDDLLSQTVPAKNWVFAFTRTAAADTLTFTCNTAGTMQHKVPHPVNADEFEIELMAAVTSLTVTAVDSITGANYGE